MVAHFLKKTAVEVEHTMTWVDLQALIEQWKYEPPVEWLMARYFEIEERPQEAEMMSDEDAEAMFAGMFASAAASGMAVYGN